MLKRVITLTKVELFKLSKQKFSYLLVVFVLINGVLVGIGSRVFPALISAMSGGGGASYDGYTFSSIIATGTFSSAGAGTIAMLAFSGSMMASETDSGTLKNMLLRPIRRHEFYLAKALALFFYCLALVVVTAVFATAAGALIYGMGDITVAETGEVYRTRAEMLANLGISYSMDLVSIFTVGCIGLMVSVLIDSAAWAVITALVIYFPVMFLKNFDYFSPWIFAAYMDLGQNILREMVVVKSKTWLPDVYSFMAVNLATIAAVSGLSLVVFRKKEIQ